MLALVVGSLCGSVLCQSEAEFSSYYSGKRYDFRLTHELSGLARPAEP